MMQAISTRENNVKSKLFYLCLGGVLIWSSGQSIAHSAGKKGSNSDSITPTHYNPSRSLAPLVEQLAPAVVNLGVESTAPSSKNPRQKELESLLGLNRPVQGMGSGFLISSDGYILTNHHVIANASSIQVRLADEREYTARVVGSDSRIDIGLVKIDSKERFPFVSLGSSKKLRVGDWVVAIGNPFGLNHTVTQGIVSAKGRAIGAGPYDDFIQTDASINPGNSGGPLFDLDGKVIGINTAVSAVGQGIGFAVPSDMVKDVLADLKKNGRVERGWIGVSLQDIAGPDLVQLGLNGKQAVRMSGVYPGTPAANAGIKVGDIILRIDGVSIGDANTLVKHIGSKRPGEVVKMRILRNGKSQTLRVKLAKRPDESSLRNPSPR